MCLPADLKDLDMLYSDPLRSVAEVKLPREKKEGVLPPLPQLEGRDLARELHILVECID